MKTLRELQLSEFEILLEFKRVCELEQLQYYLTAGTLLGAVRHGGFIPWDDDIDVAMPRKDYDLLRNCSKDLFQEGYFFQDSKTDSQFPFYFAKLRKEDTTVYEAIFSDVSIHKGEYIDIFPLDICPKEALLAKLFFKEIELLSFVYLSKVSEKYECEYKKWYMLVLSRVCKILPLSTLSELRESFRRMGAWGGKEYYSTVGGTHGYPQERYEALWFQETEYLLFEGVEFPVPKQWEEVLTCLYGAYEKEPEDKTGHFTKEEEKG